MPDLEEVLSRLRSQLEDEPGEHDDTDIMVRAGDVRALIEAAVSYTHLTLPTILLV